MSVHSYSRGVGPDITPVLKSAGAKRMRVAAIIGCVTAIGLTGCALGGRDEPPAVVIPPIAGGAVDYKFGPGDRLRIDTFGETGLSGEFLVPADGKISFPLVGEVETAGKSAGEVRAAIEAGLRRGYLANPQVTVQVLSYRPFYILGEVMRPGSYPYTAGLTVANAVATAGGFTYRANTRIVYIKNEGEETEIRAVLGPATPVLPGATVRIGERYF